MVVHRDVPDGPLMTTCVGDQDVKRLVTLLICSSLICTCGCQPTPYQRLGTGSAGGYSDTRLSEDTFHVRFVANNNTQSRTVYDYLYRRAAELTLENGFKYFAIIRGSSHLTQRMYIHASPDSWKDRVDPIETDVPDPGRLHMTIQCFKETPEDRQMHFIDAELNMPKHPYPP